MKFIFQKAKTKLAATLAVFTLGLTHLNCSPTNFGNSPSQGQSKSSSPVNTGTGTDASNTVIPPKGQAAIDSCEWARIAFGFVGSALAPGGSITNVIGSVIYSGTQVQNIADIKGSVILVGNPGGTVGNIGNVDGSVIVCGMNVANVTGLVRGSIIVVDGSVGGVSGVIGSLLVLDGNISGPTSNNIGSVLAVRTK